LAPYAAAEVGRLSLNPWQTIKQAIADVRKRRRRARQPPG